MITIKKTSMTRADVRKPENKQKDSEDTAYIYGDIGGWFGLDHLDWIKEFNAIDSKTIHLRIDSDGGDVFAARAMKTAIMQHKAKVIAHIDGIAASAASFLAMGADEIEMVDGGFLMVHNALSGLDIFGYFNSKDLDDLISELGKERKLQDKINESIASDYVKKTGVSIDKARQWMDDETWFTAEDALDNGLIDRIYDGKPVSGKYDLSLFNNTPEVLIKRSNPMGKNKKKEDDVHLDKRSAEKALRDAGFSRNMSEMIVAKGFHDEGEPQNDIVAQNEGEPQDDANMPQGEPGKAATDGPERRKDRTAELLTIVSEMVT